MDGGGTEFRLKNLQAWIKEFPQKIDVLVLNECNGLHSGDRMKTMAQACGFEHSVLLHCSTGYHIAVLSSEPIQVLRCIAAPFHHGLLHVKVLGLNVLAAHLSPVESEARVIECEAIFGLCQDLRGSVQDESIILAGDLNTLSPFDLLQHKSGDLQGILSRDKRLARKFLRASKGTQELDYRPMKVLLDAGLTDLAFAGAQAKCFRPGSEDQSTVHECPVQDTVPTQMRDDKMHATNMRLVLVPARTRVLWIHANAHLLHCGVPDLGVPFCTTKTRTLNRCSDTSPADTKPMFQPMKIS
mmetsp:Transcript_5543/g.8841  ORF Transcript_5543/g.8841 Transcript_5543/m.8841 type:complete len:299 (-) Transcript_5543:250-1146(-)